MAKLHTQQTDTPLSLNRGTNSTVLMPLGLSHGIVSLGMRAHLKENLYQLGTMWCYSGTAECVKEENINQQEPRVDYKLDMSHYEECMTVFIAERDASRMSLCSFNTLLVPQG